MMTMLVINLNGKLHEGEIAQDMVHFSELFDNVGQHPSVERGLTAGFFRSQGQKGTDKIAVQRAMADKSETAL